MDKTLLPVLNFYAMKKEFLFCLGFIFSITLVAQISNGGFEEWPDSLEVSSHDADLSMLGIDNVLRGVPVGWDLSHSLFGVCQAADNCDDNYALLLFAWYHGVETGVKKTFPISSRPKLLKGCYKYLFFDEDLDKAACYIDLVFWKGVDSIGAAHFDFDTTSLYRNFEVPITYSAESTPDSVSIRIFTNVLSSPNFPADGFLFLDDLKLEEVITGYKNPILETDFSVYPNPFANSFFIDCRKEGDFHYELYNLKGELLQSDTLSQATNSLRVAHLPEGIYILNIVGAQQQRLVQKFIKN